MLTVLTIGEREKELTVTLKFAHYKEEPQTWEYPGYPEFVEFWDIRATLLSSGDDEFEREGREDWFADLDAIAESYIESHHDEIAVEAIGHHQDEIAAAREAHWDAKREEEVVL